MPLSRPTIKDIAVRLIADLESRLTGKTALLPVALLRILCIVFAIAMHILYGILRLLSINILPDTKDIEWLRRHGKIWGVIYKEATFASGNVIFAGVNGTLIPKDTRVQRVDTGVEYETSANTTIVAGFAHVDVKAIVPGDIGNYLKDNPLVVLLLQLVSPIIDIDDTVTLVNEIDGGNDAETTDEYSLRMQQRIQQPGAGGSKADYERWALEVDGVDGAWVFPNYWGAGTCAVVIQPASGSLASTVQDYINIKQPVTANQPRLQASLDYVFPIDEVDMAYTIAIDPNDTETREAITDAVINFHNDEGVPGGTLLISHLRSAIASTGVFDYQIDAISKGGIPQPVDDIEFVGFEFPILDIITFTTLI